VVTKITINRYLFISIYREDYEVAEKFDTENEKDDMYTRLKSGAESGWDYSSRWFITTDQDSEPS